jgi:hypothetical protein
MGSVLLELGGRSKSPTPSSKDVGPGSGVCIALVSMLYVIVFLPRRGEISLMSHLKPPSDKRT